MGKYNYIRKTFTHEGKHYEVTGKTEKEVALKMAKKLDALERGEIETDKTITVDSWFRKWLDVYKKPKGLTPKSLGMYEEKYRNYIKPAIGKKKLKDVKDIHLQKVLNEQAGMSYSHVSKIRMVLQEMFKQARISRIITYDPSEALTLPDSVKRSHRSLTDDERYHVLEVAKTHRAGLWVLLMLYSGIRPGEAFALQWKDIDFDRNEIHIYKAKESGSSEIKGPKTQAGIRDIPMTEALRERLLEEKGDPFDLVLKTIAGNIHNENSTKRMWLSFLRAVDIHMGAETYRNKIVKSVVSDDLTPYCLRHTFCTDLQRAGVPINIAKELMGHSDISMTANIYTHKDQASLHDNMLKLDGLEKSLEKNRA